MGGLLSDDPAARDALEEGLALLEQGQAAEALPAFVEAVRLAPGDARAHYHQGLALYELSVVRLGGVNVDRVRLAGCIASLDQALALDPGVADYQLYRGLAAVRDRDWDTAIRCFEQTLLLDEAEVRARVQLGQAYVHVGRVADALAELERSATQAPLMPGAHHQLGLAAIEAGEWALASAAFERATELIPFESDPWYGWSTAQRRMGDGSGADLALERYHALIEAANNKPTAEQLKVAQDHFREGLGHMGEGRAEQAREAFLAVLVIQPRSAAALANLAVIALSVGDTGTATRRFREALSVNPDNTMARFHLAEILARGGRADLAACHLRALLQRDPGHGEARKLLAGLGL